MLRILSKRINLFFNMAPKNSNDLRTLNGDSQREIVNEGVVESTDSAIDYKEVQEYQVYWKPV